MSLINIELLPKRFQLHNRFFFFEITFIFFYMFEVLNSIIMNIILGGFHESKILSSYVTDLHKENEFLYGEALAVFFNMEI